MIEAQGSGIFQTAVSTVLPVLLGNTGQVTGVNLATDQNLTLQVKAASGLGTGTVQLRLLRVEATMIQ